MLSIESLLLDPEDRKIKIIAEGNFEAGNHSLNFSAEGLAKGVYLLRLETNSVVQTKKLIIQ